MTCDFTRELLLCWFSYCSPSWKKCIFIYLQNSLRTLVLPGIQFSSLCLVVTSLLSFFTSNFMFLLILYRQFLLPWASIHELFILQVSIELSDESRQQRGWFLRVNTSHYVIVFAELSLEPLVWERTKAPRPPKTGGPRTLFKVVMDTSNCTEMILTLIFFCRSINFR